jgi:hypothetical protein
MKETCDWKGKCKRKPFIEVYPLKDGWFDRSSGWSYLCFKHAIIALLRGDNFTYFNLENGIKNKLFEKLYDIIMNNYEMHYDNDMDFVELK